MFEIFFDCASVETVVDVPIAVEINAGLTDGGGGVVVVVAFGVLVALSPKHAKSKQPVLFFLF